MKLTSVELRPVGSTDVAVLSFRDPARANPFNVRAIDGLDVDLISPMYLGSGGSASFFNMVPKSRKLVFAIELNPRWAMNETPSSLRDQLYRYIAASRTGQVDVQFKNASTVVAQIRGFITKFEAPNFDQTSQIKITLESDEGFLKAPARTAIDVGTITPTLATITDGLSTAPHGFIFTMTTSGAFATLSIEDPDNATWSFDVTPSGGFLSGDVINFSSEVNNKHLYLVRGVSTIYLADAIIPGSQWPILFPGQNKLTVSPTASVAWTTFAYYPTYWGV